MFLGATKPEGTDRIDNSNQMVNFKCQMALSEITGIDPLDLDLDQELKHTDNYPIFASSPM